MISDAAAAFEKNYDAIMDGTYHADLFENTGSGLIIDILSDLSERLIYTSSIKTRPELFGRRVIHSLLDQFMPPAILFEEDDSATFIDRRTMDTVSDFYKLMYWNESADQSEADRLYLRILMITDYISGMTDSYAKRLYQELFI